MSRNVVIVIVVVVLVACALLALCAAVAAVGFLGSAPFRSGGPGLASTGEEVNKSFEVQVPAHLVVHETNGGVRVVGGADGRIEVRATKHAAGVNASQQLASIQVDIQQQGNTVQVTTRMTGAVLNAGRWVDYEITVPTQTDVEVTSDNGGVSVEGVTGKLSATNHNGAVDMAGVQGQVVVQNDNGPITLRDANISQLNARNHNGPVEFTGSLTGGGDSQVETDNGAVQLTLSADDKLNIQASSSNGSIDSQLSLTNENKGRRNLSGQLNGGGSNLTIRTSNGSITLRAR